MKPPAALFTTVLCCAGLAGLSACPEPVSPDAGPERENDSGVIGAICNGLLDAFIDKRDELAIESETYVCADASDCQEVKLCRSDSCSYGPLFNDDAAGEVDDAADPVERCEECVTGEPEPCPEPEGPPPGCIEGVCLSYDSADPEPPAPTSCPDHIASLALFERASGAGSTQGCAEDADCTVFRFQNGCTEGACHEYPVHVQKLGARQAQLQAHLQYNDCSSCGAEVDCPAPAPSVRCNTSNSRCELVP